MRSALRFLSIVSLASVLAIGVSKLPAAEQNATQKAEHATQHAYLGMKVEAVRPGTLKNVPEQFRMGQGVEVSAVAPGSPAEKAGIKAGDIIMSFDDQRLFSPLQLVGLVRSDKAGRQADLTVFRDNKPEQIKVTIGSRQWGSARTGSERAWNQENKQQNNGSQATQGRTQSQSASPNKAQGNEANQMTFDSLVLENIGKDRFRVQTQYLDKKGNMEKHKFEGTLKELHQKIAAEKDLPSIERSQLLRSLDLPAEIGEVPALSSRGNRSTNEGEQHDGAF